MLLTLEQPDPIFIASGSLAGLMKMMNDKLESASMEGYTIEADLDDKIVVSCYDEDKLVFTYKIT